MEEITCQLCSAASHLKFNAKGYVQHIQLFHAHKANFRITCGINGCQKISAELRQMGLTKERIRQIKESAIRKIRNNVGDIFDYLVDEDDENFKRIV